MDFLDFLWNCYQNGEINELRRQLQSAEMWAMGKADVPSVKKLAAENFELKRRLGLLVRLLIEKRIFTAEEYARLIAETTATEPGVRIQPLEDRNSH